MVMQIAATKPGKPALTSARGNNTTLLPHGIVNLVD